MGRGEKCSRPITLAPEEGAIPDWGRLVSAFLHPLKVQIIEALLWVDLPLSAIELASLFSGSSDWRQTAYYCQKAAYHSRALQTAGVLRTVKTQKVRGATQTFYRLEEPAWAAIAGALLHPVKVQVVEALSWIDRPLSAKELADVFAGDPNTGKTSHHCRDLLKHGLIVLVEERRVRGASQVFYKLSDDVLVAGRSQFAELAR